ncbi:unnamed protein product [Linum tenue]|nr:unnamed protein product [Linum tenue]
MNSKLGFDLLLEILIRLPNPRSACHCKLVCQLWRSVISHTSFNRRYVSHRQTMSPDDLKSMILSFLPPMESEVGDALKVLDCNRDLVLCGFWVEHRLVDGGERSRSYLVCNPFTKQWAALPLAPKKLVLHLAPVTRLVLEPQQPVSRFRVVCMYQQVDPILSIKLDVFCSESGEWIKDALVRDDHIKRTELISWNGELFWMYLVDHRFALQPVLAVFDPFRLDVPPTSVDVPSSFLAQSQWIIALSQDALHAIARQREDLPFRLSVWRLEEDRKSWKKQCEGLVNKASKCCGNCRAKFINQPFMHPQKPEIVFFNCASSINEDNNNAVLFCDLTSGEVDFVAKLAAGGGLPDFLEFQPRVSSWDTPIPKLDKDSFGFLFNSSSDPTKPCLRFRDAAFAPAKSLLLTDNKSKARRVARRVVSGRVLRKQQVLGSKQQ